MTAAADSTTTSPWRLAMQARLPISAATPGATLAQARAHHRHPVSHADRPAVQAAPLPALNDPATVSRDMVPPSFEEWLRGVNNAWDGVLHLNRDEQSTGHEVRGRCEVD